MKPRILLPMCSLLASLPLAADSISINFGSDDPNAGESGIVDAGKTSGAIPITGDLWNNLTGGTGTGVAIDADAGPGGTVSWTSSGTWRSGSTGSTATSENGALTKGYIDDGGAGTNVTVVSPYLLNDIYLIPATDGSGEYASYSVNGVFYRGDGVGATLSSASAQNWTGAVWTAADTLTEGVNYLKVLGQAGVSIAGPRNGAGRASIAGLQIEDAYTGTLSFWDTNGTDPESGDAGGTWGSDNFWSTSADGDVATTAWTAGQAAVFSAGTDGTGFNTVTISGTQAADAIWVQEGEITLSGGTLDLSSGLGLLRADDFPLTVDSSITAVNLTTVGLVDLNGTNTITGTATISGGTILGSDQTFPRVGGAGDLDLFDNSLTVGDASDSSFGGALLGDASSTLNKVGSGSVIMGDPTDFVGTATVAAGTLGFTQGLLDIPSFTGTGSFAKAGGGLLTVISDIALSGNLDIRGGTLQVGNIGTTGSIGTPGSVALNNSRLTYRLSGANATLSSPVTIGAGGGFIRQNSGLDTDLLTITSTVGADTTVGALEVNSGDMVLGSGAAVKVKDVALVGPPAGDRGTLLVEAGATLDAGYLNIGNGGSQSGIINQTGGTVTMTEGGTGIRIGHWDNGSNDFGSEYNISGGTLDASKARLSVGWDGKGTLDISGTGIVKANRLDVDENGADRPGIVNLASGGRLEVGTGGITFDATAGSVLNLAGGTLAGVGSSNWNALLDANTATSSSIEVASGVTSTQTNGIQGDGDLTKTGAGTLVLSSAANTYTGAASVSGGTLRIVGSPIPDAASLTIASGGTIGVGTSTASGTGTVTTLNLAAGSSSNFRVGPTSDELVVSALDGLNTAATHTITVQPSGALAVNDVFSVIDYDGTIQGSGFGGLALAPFPNPHYALSLVDNTLDTTIDIAVTGVTPITWTGPGSWNTTNTNWNDGVGTSAFFAADIVNFNDLGAAESVVVDNNGGVAPISPASMSFNNTTASTYTVSGDPISGIGGLTKTGDGSVILTNDNTFTGAMDIQAGTLQVGDGGTTGSLGSGEAINVVPPAEIVFNRSDASSLARSTIGGGDFVVDSGSLTVTSSNNAVNMVVNGGTLLARGGAWATAFNAAQTITVNTGGTLDTVVHSLGGLGAGGILPALIHVNGGTWLLNNEQYANALSMTGGMTTGAGEVRTTGGGLYTINASAEGSMMAARVNMVGGKTFQIADGAADADLLISGPIVGGGALIKTGPGKLVTSGVNTGSGDINVDEGEVVFTGDNSGRTGGTALNGTTLNTASVSNAAIGSGFLALNGGTLNYSGAGSETTTRLLWINQGSGTFDITNASGVLMMNPTGGTVDDPVIKNGPGRLVLQGAITGPASVTANGGRLDLDGANTYTGDTTINTGALVTMGSATLDDASTLLINGSGVLDLDHGANDVIGALVLDGVPQTTPGTYGSAGSGADFQSAFFAGTGTVEIVDPSANDYDTWAVDNGYWTPGSPNTLPGDDFDGDGLSNEDEYAFGLNPTDSSSVNPYSAPLDPATGMFSYTRRDPALTGWTYAIETSTTLNPFAVDATATQTPGATDSEGNQTVVVTLTGGAPTDPKLFVRVVGTAPAP